MSNVFIRQQKHKKELNQIWENPENVNIIHYSCESFYDRPDGASPRTTSIAVRNLKTAQTRSFSIHKFGELRGIAAANFNNHYNDLEREMLEEFFNFANEKREYKWVHWNMRDENYGFHAIEQRLKVLGGTPSFLISDDKKFDLARILIGIYGKGYTGHPRLESLKELNGISPLHFKTGKEEADLFANGNYVALHQSTLSKVDLLANLCQLAYEKKLKTLSNFWELNGESWKAIIEWIKHHWIISVFTIMSAIAGAMKFFDLF